MPSYITAAALRLVLPDAGSVASPTADDAALDAIVARASAVVDGYCARTWPEKGAAEDRTFYGTGTERLRIDWTDDTVDEVTVPSSITAPSFVEIRNAASDYLALHATTSDGRLSTGWCDVWPDGYPVTINAEWGYTTFPLDVVEATVLIATARWRETYAAGLTDWQGDVGRDYQIPPNAREILDRLRLASTFTVGGGL